MFLLEVQSGLQRSEAVELGQQFCAFLLVIWLAGKLCFILVHIFAATPSGWHWSALTCLIKPQYYHFYGFGFIISSPVVAHLYLHVHGEQYDRQHQGSALSVLHSSPLHCCGHKYIGQWSDRSAASCWDATKQWSCHKYYTFHLPSLSH